MEIKKEDQTSFIHQAATKRGLSLTGIAHWLTNFSGITVESYVVRKWIRRNRFPAEVIPALAECLEVDENLLKLNVKVSHSVAKWEDFPTTRREDWSYRVTIEEMFYLTSIPDIRSLKKETIMDLLTVKRIKERS